MWGPNCHFSPLRELLGSIGLRPMAKANPGIWGFPAGNHSDGPFLDIHPSGGDTGTQPTQVSKRPAPLKLNTYLACHPGRQLSKEGTGPRNPG